MDLVFKRDVLNLELNWVQIMQSIVIMMLMVELEIARIGSSSVTEFEPTFSNVYFHLTIMTFLIQFVLRLSQYFPNLKELTIRYCKITSDYLISELTVPECLSDLCLRDLPKLMDSAFTIECTNRYAASFELEEVIIAPGIACFKSLKTFGIFSCPLLTDNRIIEGIAKNKT